MRNLFIRPVACLGMVLLSLVLLGCGERKETSANSETRSREVKWVKVCPVNASPPEGVIEYVGALTAHRKVTVACEMGGTIERLYFEKGDRVEKGQLLAEISTSSIRLQVRQAKAAFEAARSHLAKMEKGSRPEEISIAEAALEEAEAALLESEKNFGRIKDLSEFRAVSNSEYDSARRRVEIARARVESARNQLSLARQGPREEDRKAARANMEQAEAALGLARDRLKKSRLLAPINGIIAFRDVEEGEVIVVPPVTIITQVIDLEHLKIKLSLGEKDIRLLEKDKSYVFTIDAFPQEIFSCRLLFLSPTADPATRSFPAELMVEEPDERMADGMTVRVKFPIVDERRKVKVPSAWLSEESGEIGLFVVRDGEAIFKKVTIGAYYDQRVEIISGLDGQALVITNPAGLKHGDRVQYAPLSGAGAEMYQRTLKTPATY